MDIATTLAAVSSTIDFEGLDPAATRLALDAVGETNKAAEDEEEA